MKYKILTKEQIIISLDRLTRFKNTKEKYLRVFTDILISNMIEPKLKKSDIEKSDFSKLTDYVSEIINVSLEKINPLPTSQTIKKEKIQEYLREYENSVFINSEETQNLLNNNIDYSKAISIIPKDSSANLKWLSTIIKIFEQENFSNLSNEEINNYIKMIRNESLLKFPIEKVILVEGITEEILLPAFSQKLGYDFYANGIQIIPAGGKNQVVKMYYKLASELKIPIFVLLDKDAEDNIAQIKPRLRNEDKIHLVSCGEFEDLLPKSLILKTVNSHFKNFLKISIEDLCIDSSMVKVLEELFKTKGLHEFKKAEFAKLVKDNINSLEDISAEIKTIIEEIFFENKVLDTKVCS